jgi:hypothetical protein
MLHLSLEFLSNRAQFWIGIVVLSVLALDRAVSLVVFFAIHGEHVDATALDGLLNGDPLPSSLGIPLV